MKPLESISESQQELSVGKLLFILGIIFVSFNLRPSITAVGPLIGSITLDLHISNTSAGLLTTLPLLAFAIVSPIAPKIGKSLGNETTIFLALIILTVGIFIRSAGFISSLFIGTALLGISIAIVNVLLPGIIKQRFPLKIGILTAVYTTSMGIMAALASGFSIPLATNMGLGWQKSLSFWAILATLTLLVWLPQLQKSFHRVELPIVKSVKRSIWRSAIAWQVTLFMGFQSFIFYCLIAWLPAILSSRGLDVSTGGWMLALMQFAGLPATFFVPIIAGRLSNQKGIVIAIGIFYITAFTGLLISGNTLLITLFIILIGLAQGAGISLALTLFGLRTKNGIEAANLSGMAQSIGYLLAAIGPIIIGHLFDHFLHWTPGLLVLLSVTIALVVVGLGAGRNKFIFE
ncbi:CynX/NimT family MFS transporter [Anaerobacillus sp. MEB173]|uniref:CynX/NimT family MFS transporter n=1 Tax=Anaerobacillus sp. MEB173 TaxID=3383345 RepID=UPI003F8E2C1D